MTTDEKALEIYQHPEGYSATECMAANEIAYNALRERIERQSGCEYCNGTALDNVGAGIMFGVPKIFLHSGSEKIEESARLKVCPVCGRKRPEEGEEAKNEKS